MSSSNGRTASVGQESAERGLTRRFAVYYDPPAETHRMFYILVACVVFSVLGLILAARAKIEAGPERQRDKIFAAAIALSGGLFTIGLISARFKPGGSHARRIVLELTGEEIRLWGGGYGTRIRYEGVSNIRYRKVDTFLGRLGAMRQYRMSIEGGGKRIEVAREASEGDDPRTVQLSTGSISRAVVHTEGGEGDCVVLESEEFDAFDRALLARLPEQG